MYTAPAARGRGRGPAAAGGGRGVGPRRTGCKRVILETGDRQPEAIALYESAGYERIPDFGYYKDARACVSFGRISDYAGSAGRHRRAAGSAADGWADGLTECGARDQARTTLPALMHEVQT